MRQSRANYLYACKIKETTNGRRSSACRQARKALEVFAARRLTVDVQIDEQKTAARLRQDKTQKTADQKTKKALARTFSESKPG